MAKRGYSLISAPPLAAAAAWDSMAKSRRRTKAIPSFLSLIRVVASSSEVSLNEGQYDEHDAGRRRQVIVEHRVRGQRQNGHDQENERVQDQVIAYVVIGCIGAEQLQQGGQYHGHYERDIVRLVHQELNELCQSNDESVCWYSSCVRLVAVNSGRERG